MFKTFFIIVYCLLTAYIYWRVAGLVHGKYRLFRLFTVGILCLSLLATMLWAEKLPFEVNVWAHQISHFWLFSFAYTVPTALVFHIYGLFRKNKKPSPPQTREPFSSQEKKPSPPRWLLVLLLLLGSGILVWGYLKYKQIEVVELEIPVQSWSPDHPAVTVVFASDLHFGYTITRSRAKEMVDALMAQKADLLLFGGDLIDRSVLPVRQQKIELELRRLHARYGVYSVLGNHEGYKDAPENHRFLESCGIRLLMDTAVLIPGAVNLIGRIEVGKRNNQRAALMDTVRPDDFRTPLAKLQAMLPQDQQAFSTKKQPTILLDHVPKIPSAEQLEGIDLMLSGHTHNGQIFPFNLLLRKTNELSYGAAKKGNALVYVTSGLGLWGARFRLGTQTEIVKIRFVPVQGEKVQLLFTGDMHAQLRTERTTGQGGFARLATAIEQEKAAFSGPTLTVDAGDFTMGSKYHTLFPFGPAEPQLLQAMGYDAFTLGNHEFDFTAEGLNQALARIPDADFRDLLILPNLLLTDKQQKRWPILAGQKTKLIRKCLVPGDTLRIGVFGILGTKAIADAPTAGIAFSDPFDHARSCVRELQRQKADVIVALSHNGTAKHNSENDYALAKKVEGIDVIVSGHSHAVLKQAWTHSQGDQKVKTTTLVSAGSQGAFLGKLILARSPSKPGHPHSWNPLYHRLIPMDSTRLEDPEINRRIGELDALVNTHYFSHFGYQAENVLAESDVVFPGLNALQSHFGDNGVTQLITDAFVYAGQRYDPDLPHSAPAKNGEERIPTVGVLGMGNLRATLPTGSIRTQDIFNLLSFGSGPDGRAGFPLISVYLNRSELLTLCEMDANIGKQYGDFQLQFSGLKYYANPLRPLFNKVYRLEVAPAHLYRVVTNLYAAQRLADVENLSYKLLKIRPKNAKGQPIDSMQVRILRNRKGIEIKEWLAVAEYLQSEAKLHSSANNGAGSFPERYAQPEIRKDLHPPGILRQGMTLFGHCNVPGFLQWMVGLGIIGLLVYTCFRRMRRSKNTFTH